MLHRRSVALLLALWPAAAFWTAATAGQVTTIVPECSPPGEDCTKTHCCNETGLQCFQKNQYWASCKDACAPGIDENDPKAQQTPWTCNVLTPLPASSGWSTGLLGSYFWDCNGAGCDATVLQPFQQKKFIYAPQYAPADPEDHGGAGHGEKLWMTGAASDDLAALLGPSTSCCGDDKKSPGCGQCLLVRNPTALRPDWTAIVMKKSRCPPWTNGCETGFLHMDFAVPGYDHLGISTANVCGKPQVVNTYISQDESAVCSNASAAGIQIVDGVPSMGCKCSGLPDKTPEQQLLKKGCELFTSWGWTSGNPVLEYKSVECPEAFTMMIADSFGLGGVSTHGPSTNRKTITIVAIVVGVCCIGACVAQFVQSRPKKRGGSRGPPRRPPAGQRPLTSSSSDSDS